MCEIVNLSEHLPYVANLRKQNSHRKKEEEAVFKLRNQYSSFVTPRFFFISPGHSAFPGCVIPGPFY